MRQAKDATKEVESYLREERQEEVEKLKTRAEEAEKNVETLQRAVDKSRAIRLEEQEQLREENRKLEEENKLFAQVNAKQMTMIESLELIRMLSIVKNGYD